MKTIYTIIGIYSDWDGGDSWVVRSYVNKLKAQIFLKKIDGELEAAREKYLENGDEIKLEYQLSYETPVPDDPLSKIHLLRETRYDLVETPLY